MEPPNETSNPSPSPSSQSPSSSDPHPNRPLGRHSRLLRHPALHAIRPRTTRRKANRKIQRRINSKVLPDWQPPSTSWPRTIRASPPTLLGTINKRNRHCHRQPDHPKPHLKPTSSQPPSHRAHYPTRRTAAATKFAPTVFYRSYSALNKPVLTINPGDTVHTTTIDAAGNDLNNVCRSAGGNPETGPFSISRSPMPMRRPRRPHQPPPHSTATPPSPTTTSLRAPSTATSPSRAYGRRRVTSNGASTSPKEPASPAKPDEQPRPLHRPAPPPCSAAHRHRRKSRRRAQPRHRRLPAPTAATWTSTRSPKAPPSTSPSATPEPSLWSRRRLRHAGDGEDQRQRPRDLQRRRVHRRRHPQMHVIRFPRVETPTHIIALGYSGSTDD